jgi:hypothetical protein
VAEIFQGQTQRVSNRISIVCNQNLHAGSEFSTSHATGLQGRENGPFAGLGMEIRPKLAIR